jgi:hypothetical protein
MAVWDCGSNIEPGICDLHGAKFICDLSASEDQPVSEVGGSMTSAGGAGLENPTADLGADLGGGATRISMASCCASVATMADQADRPITVAFFSC